MPQFIKTISNEIIDLGNDDVNAVALKSIIDAKCPDKSIKEIHITKSKLGDEGAVYVAGLIRDNKSLEAVHLVASHNFLSRSADQRITSVGMKVLALALRLNKSVETLDLSGNNIGDRGANFIKDMLPRSGVKFLNLDYNDISATGIGFLSEALKNKSDLASLSLVGNTVGNKGVEVLAEALHNNTYLKHLDLSNNNIKEAGAACIAKLLPNCLTLQRLSLQNNNVSADGMIMIAEGLAVNKSLRFLDLSRNVSKDCKPHARESIVKVLAAIIPQNTSLISLDLSGNSLVGLSSLANAVEASMHLEVLTLGIADNDQQSAVGRISFHLANNARRKGELSLLAASTGTTAPLLTQANASNNTSANLETHDNTIDTKKRKFEQIRL